MVREMKKASKFLVAVMLYVYATSTVMAAMTPCEAIKIDVQAAQEAARNAELGQIETIYEGVKGVSKNVTNVCLSAISSMDIRALGGMSGPIVQAAQRLCEQAARNVTGNSSGNVDIMRVINDVSGGALDEVQRQMAQSNAEMARVFDTLQNPSAITQQGQQQAIDEALRNINNTDGTLGTAGRNASGEVVMLPSGSLSGGTVPSGGVTVFNPNTQQPVSSVTTAAQDVWKQLSGMLR